MDLVVRVLQTASEPSRLEMQVLSVPNPNVPGTVGMFPIEVHAHTHSSICFSCGIATAAEEKTAEEADIFACQHCAQTELWVLPQDCHFVQDLVSLIKKRAPHQTYTWATSC